MSADPIEHTWQATRLTGASLLRGLLQTARPIFDFPSGLVVAVSGDLYVADAYGASIRRVAPDGTLHLHAGTGQVGYGDGQRLLARFNFPSGLSTDAKGYLYVADAGNHCIRKGGRCLN